MKHTPGPWIAVGTYVETSDASKAGICQCSTSWMRQDHFGRSIKEECANARLIAAAPELLDALVDLLPLAEFGAAEQSPPYADDSLLEAARAAIAKATGTQE